MKLAEPNQLEPACEFLRSLKLETVSSKDEQHVVVLYEEMTLEQALLVWFSSRGTGSCFCFYCILFMAHASCMLRCGEAPCSTLTTLASAKPMPRLQALASRHILSAPVMTGRAQDASQEGGATQFRQDRDVVGFLDIRDILLNFLNHLGHVHELLKMPMLKRMHELETAGGLFSRKLVSDIHAYGTDGNFLHSGRVRLLFLGKLL